MKRLLLVLAALAAVALPGAANAHPLGNFSVNRYSRIEPAADGVRVLYVLDMAEIPTFQERPGIEADPEAYADRLVDEIRQNLSLTVAGRPVPLRLQQRTLALPEGQGGLPTLRLEARFDAHTEPGETELAYRDDNEPNRVGWREIVARPAQDGTVLERSSVPVEDVTDELRHYPDDLLSTPRNVRQASLTFKPGMSGGEPMAAYQAPTVFERTRGAFAELARTRDVTPGFVALALATAVILGAAHALQPGHGKTVVAAYMVGARGTPLHALFLGVTVTLTHTAGVYGLGAVTVFLSQYIVPERLYPILETVSGLLVVSIGVWLFGRRLLAAVGVGGAAEPRQDQEHAHDQDDDPGHGHGHGHGHEHGHGHRHHHHAAGAVGWRGLLALGISGGLLPCPEALMVLLITIAAHQVLLGLLLIVAFSLGLASVLVGFGLLLVYARALFQRLDVSGGLAPRLLPIASAAVIVVAGGLITLQALPRML